MPQDPDPLRDSSPLYLALDQGGSQSRGLIIDAHGRVLHQAAVAVATRRPRAQWVEQDPAAVSASLLLAANRVVAALPVPQRARLQACGIACQRSSLLAWDRMAQRPLSPLLSWQDTRGAARLPDDPAQLQRLRQLSGLYPSAHHGASKCAWLLGQAEIRRAAARGRLQLLPLGAYLAQQLCGRLALDPANAQRTLLWDYRARDWSDEALALFGLDRTLLPPLQPSLADWGRLRLELRALPCRLLAGDQSVAPLAGGTPAVGVVQINLGTGAFLCTPDRDYPCPRLLHSLAYQGDQQQLAWLEGTVNGAGAALQWLAHQPPRSDPVDPARPALFLNAVGGLGSPFWRADRRSRFINTPDGARAAAVLDSILFLLQSNLAAMAAAGVPLQQLRLSGGLSRRAGLAQALADLSGLPVALMAEAEATARGMVWLLAAQPHAWQEDPPQRFDPRGDAALAARYRCWRHALAAWLAEPA